MHCGGVVPHHQVTHLPVVLVDELSLCCMLHEIQQQHSGFGDVHAFDLASVDPDKKYLATGAGIGLDQGPAYRRYGFALLFGVLCIAE